MEMATWRITKIARMLINGPAEWNAELVSGVKANVLQDGYNPKLGVSATSFGHTVVVTRYTDTDSATGLQRLLSQPANVLKLHGDNSNNKDKRYRLIAWSLGSAEKSLLAIATMAQVEIWEVTATHSTSDVSAILRGSVEVNRPQGVVWNPQHEVLLVYSKTDITLINAAPSTLSWRTIHKDTSTHQAWGACSWSPCGMQVSLAQSHVLHCFSWMNMDSLLSESPKHDQIDASSSYKSINGLRLDGGYTKVGHIAAVVRVSPTICFFTTHRLVLEDSSRAAPVLNSELRKTNPIEKLSSSRGENYLDIREQPVTLSSGIIDLTSIRVSTSSTQDSLRILNRAEDNSTCRILPGANPCSRMLIAEYEAGKWSIKSILDLPNLAVPDTLVIQNMFVIIGSTLSSRLIVAHLNVSDRMEWTASFSGELELPPTHVCRGISLTELSPFVDVASTEKRKRTTFFHAAVDVELHPIFLSQFKVPRGAQPKTNQETLDDKAFNASDEDTCTSDGNKDLLELILTKMAAIQTQMNSRFDNVDEKLQQLTARINQLERYGGISK